MTGYWALLILPWALLAGWWFRVRGGGGGVPYLPRIIRLVVWALLMTVPIWWLAPWWAALLTVLAVAGATSLGHGDFLDFSMKGKGDPDELMAPLADYITGERSSFRHDFIGMGLTGLLYTLVPGIIAGYFAGPLWLLWCSVGLLKGVSYAIGYRFAVPELGIEPTVLGEYLTGFSIVLATGLLWYFLSAQPF